jgi:hypothetical protein
VRIRDLTRRYAAPSVLASVAIIARTPDLSKHVMIVRVDPLLASRHALVAGCEHLPRVLFPNFQSMELFFQRERAILNQCVGRRVV